MTDDICKNMIDLRISMNEDLGSQDRDDLETLDLGLEFELYDKVAKSMGFQKFLDFENLWFLS